MRIYPSIFSSANPDAGILWEVIRAQLEGNTVADKPVQNWEPTSPQPSPSKLPSTSQRPSSHPEAPYQQKHLPPKSTVRQELLCSGAGAHPSCSSVQAEEAAGEIPALAEQYYPTIGFSVPSTREGFVWAITAGLLSDGRDVRHGLHLIKVIRFHSM